MDQIEIEMIYEFLRIGYLFLPFLGGSILLGFCIKYELLECLTIPIDFHLTICGRRLFGDNKTFRGVVVSSFGTAVVFVIQANLLHGVSSFQALETFNYGEVNSWILGFSLGIVAILSELPNSFVKRQLDIPAGGIARGIWRPIFHIVDQLDLLLGTWLLLSLVTEVSLKRIIISVVIVFFVHQALNIIGYFLGMRKTLH